MVWLNNVWYELRSNSSCSHFRLSSQGKLVNCPVLLLRKVRNIANVKEKRVGAPAQEKLDLDGVDTRGVKDHRHPSSKRVGSWATRVWTATYRIPIELPGMLTSAVTENFGKLTLLRFLIAVIVTGAQAKKAEDAEPKKPPAKAIEPVEETKTSLLTAPKSPEDDDAWIDKLAQLDLTNDSPSPLFVMILPAKEDGCYFVVVRQRYLPLAMNVLDNLPSFLQFHLGELSFPNFIRVIKNWSATDLAYQNRKLHIEWVPSELRFRCIDDPTDEQGPQVRDPMDFLLCMEDPVEILEGTLHIDIHAKHVRDVDDGLSVLGYLDDWNNSRPLFRPSRLSLTRGTV
ncbi:unnamed protein product [Cylindrotheca closterium]|uniref:Uncharacterized protein n=1 Tax=Cylindrotheca closterium TaxID=2856 RepID=A0AAD2CRS6_9STRA|nr:unnamed protein product [Cylindrotheca closterium]